MSTIDQFDIQKLPQYTTESHMDNGSRQSYLTCSSTQNDSFVESQVSDAFHSGDFEKKNLDTSRSKLRVNDFCSLMSKIFWDKFFSHFQNDFFYLFNEVLLLYVFVNNSVDSIIAARLLLRTPIFAESKFTIVLRIVQSTTEVVSYVKKIVFDFGMLIFGLILIGLGGGAYTDSSFYDEIESVRSLKTVQLFAVLDSSRPLNYKVFSHHQKYQRWKLVVGGSSVSHLTENGRPEIMELQEDIDLRDTGFCSNLGIPIACLIVDHLPSLRVGVYMQNIWLCLVAVAYLYDIGKLSRIRYELLVRPLKEKLMLCPTYRGTAAKISWREHILLPFVDAQFCSFADVLSSSLHLFSRGFDLVNEKHWINESFIAYLRDRLLIKDKDFNSSINSVESSLLDITLTRLGNFSKSHNKTSLTTVMYYLNTQDQGRFSHFFFGNLLLTVLAHGADPESPMSSSETIILINKILKNDLDETETSSLQMEIKNLVFLALDDNRKILTSYSPKFHGRKDLLRIVVSNISNSLCHPDVLHLICHINSERDMQKRILSLNSKGQPRRLAVLLTVITSTRTILYAYTPSDQCDYLTQSLQEFRRHKCPSLKSEGVTGSFVFEDDPSFDWKSAGSAISLHYKHKVTDIAKDSDNIFS